MQVNILQEIQVNRYTPAKKDRSLTAVEKWHSCHIFLILEYYLLII